MCELKIVKTDRPISNELKVKLIDYYDFVKISNDKIINVLKSDSREGYSKSYYYYIRDYLNRLRILKENMIDIKIVFPFEKRNENLILKEGILYLTKDKDLVYMNLSSNVYDNCMICKVKPFCVFYLNKVISENKLKISIDKERPNESWDRTIKELQTKYVKTKVIEIKS
jgi:uncharacterized protein YehS (DUF1456 family)